MDRTALSSAVLPSVTDRQVLEMTFIYCYCGLYLASVSCKSNQLQKAKKNYKALLVLTPTWKRYEATACSLKLIKMLVEGDNPPENEVTSSFLKLVHKKILFSF